jgi:hypothetical protein
MSKTWTTTTLRATIERRGEHLPRNTDVEKAVLAFERMNGRTDENYSRSKAKTELTTQLDRLNYTLPPEQGKEFVGLKQLRQFAREAKQEWEKDQPKSAFSALIANARGRLSPDPDRKSDPHPDPDPDDRER